MVPAVVTAVAPPVAVFIDGQGRVGVAPVKLAAKPHLPAAIGRLAQVFGDEGVKVGAALDLFNELFGDKSAFRYFRPAPLFQPAAALKLTVDGGESMPVKCGQALAVPWGFRLGQLPL